LEFILSSKNEDERKLLDEFTRKVDKEIWDLNLSMLGEKATPPTGY